MKKDEDFTKKKKFKDAKNKFLVEQNKRLARENIYLRLFLKHLKNTIIEVENELGLVRDDNRS